jgi:flagellar biosynthesis GTPase FlhF
MAYKNKQDADKYYQEYYFRKYGHYPKPLIRKSKEEKLAKKRAWTKANADKEKAYAKKSRKKHKEQRKLDHKLWLEKNKDWSREYHKQYNKQWYQKNKVKRSLQLKQYQQTHRKEAVKYTQAYVKRNSQKVKDYNKKYGQTSIGVYRYIVVRAKKWVGIIITLEEFKKIISNPCVYCGENKNRRGIDRIDNSKGYTVENSAPCCKVCNYMKRTMTVMEFLMHIKK